MPLVEFDPEEKKGSPFDFPKLKLRHGEQVRLVFLQPKETHAEFVHVFRAPVIVNGRAETEQVQNRDGSTITRMKMAFIRQVVCKGDYAVLKDKGIDPTCPACEASLTHSDAIPAPNRRFAANVIKYQTKPGGTFALSEPYQVSVVAWAFPQRTFDKIITGLEEQDTKDLRMHDILLGPCENENFQKFEILVSNKAEWITSEERKKHTAEVWRNNQAPDLDVFIGNRATTEQMNEDVQVVLLRHRQAQGITSPEPQVAEAEVDSLLDEMKAQPPMETTVEPPVTSPVDDLLSVEAPAASNGGESSEPVSFEDLLKTVEDKQE